MTREEGWDLVCANVQNKNLRKHMVATESVLKSLATRLNEPIELWSFTGLVHDIDVEKTDAEQHTLITARILEEKRVAPEIIHAIKAHNQKVPVASNLDRALFATDSLTGLIVACALIHPGKKLKSIDTKFVLNRFGEKRFAVGARREDIQTCAELGLTLEQFIELALTAMQEIDKDLGL
ncbi:MAG: HDIG domain-containing protein [bacterium]|nr:HDIG domain-containing protein [bacterium]